MKKPNITLIAFICAPLLILLFFSSNIYGYFRFKHYCSSEGGLRVYEKLERNVGWLAEDRGLAINAAMLNNVLYSRYTDTKTSITYDVKYIGGIVGNESSYKFSPASYNKPLYSLTESTAYLSDNNRLKKISYTIFNEQRIKMVEFNNFYYSTWGGNMGGPDWMSCSIAHDWRTTLEKAFR